MAIRHAFTSEKSEGPDASLVRANDWNADHTLDAAAPSGLTGATTPARFVGGTVAGAPSTGTFAAGDFVSSQDGKIYICVSAGSPGVWIAVSGGTDLVQVASGAGNVRIPGLSGSPDILPASPSAYDDEFDTLTGWTTLGTLDVLNVTDFPSHLHMKRAQAAWNVDGIYKAIPSMPFTVTCKMNDYFLKDNYEMHGLLLAEAGPGKLVHWGPWYVAGENMGYVIWNSRTSRNTYAYAAKSRLKTAYLRLVVTSSTSVAFQYSEDGLIWVTMYTGINPGFTIAYVGLAMSGNDNADTVEGVWDWIRFS